MKKPPRKRQPSAPQAPALTRAKVPPPRNLTPELCDRLPRDVMKACLCVAETHGLTVEGGNLADIDLRDSFAISFRVGIPQEDGTIYSPDKAMFQVLAPHFGLEPSDDGRTFRSNDELFRIVAINPNRPKFPVSAERVSDGRGFKFLAENVVMYLQHSGTQLSAHAFSSTKRSNMHARARWANEPWCAIGSSTMASDEYTREALMIRVDRKLNSTDVLDALTDLFIPRGPPEYIRSDNGPEFFAQKVRDWIAAVGAKTAYIEPGSPQENAYCESFNGDRPVMALWHCPGAACYAARAA